VFLTAAVNNLFMLYAILFALIITVVASYFFIPKKIVRLRKLDKRLLNGNYIWRKINSEIKIFNRLKLIVPCKGGIPILYLKWLSALHVNVYKVLKNADGIERLMYLCACADLYLNSRDEFKQRQIVKNCILVFGMKNKINLYKSHRSLKPCMRKAYTVPQPVFKLLGGGTLSKFIRREKNIVFSNSYFIKKVGNTVIKYYIDRELPAECFEIRGKHRFSYCFGADKMKYKIGYTADTFYCTSHAGVTAIFVTGTSANFENSLTEKTDYLYAYINLKSGNKVHIIYAKTRQEAAAFIIKIRQRGIKYLQPSEQIIENRQVENLYKKAFFSKFVTGEKLKKRYDALARQIPTLYLPTLVYEITDPNGLFDITDRFDLFKEIVRTGVNLNVVVLYSSQNDIVCEYIKAFTHRRYAQSLISSGVFLFFIDKITATNGIVYYLSKMAEAGNSLKFSGSDNFLTCGKRETRQEIHDLGGFYIVSRKNISYSVINQYTGAVKYHRLPLGAYIKDGFGRIIERGYDAVTKELYIVTAKSVLVGAEIPKRKRTSA
jgi:hypothetical protein